MSEKCILVTSGLNVYISRRHVCVIPGRELKVNTFIFL
jgi:hypothetical protein